MLQYEIWNVYSYESRDDHAPLRVGKCMTEKEAIREAKKRLDDYPEELIAIEYFRSSDGQTLYMDLDGNYTSSMIYF